ncbi:MAG: hypothetical protein HKN76_22310 [Saprospiraceae bacterium]|nr:hypothetical protein [Saprospiraceae bacterium]
MKILRSILTISKLLALLVMLLYQTVPAQELMQVEGAISVGDSGALIPEAGTIRWNGKDFEGFNGFFWVPLSRISLGSVTDREGNEYKTLVIGNREWMVENLRATVYNDSTIIANIEDTLAWGLLGDPAYCWYANDRVTYEFPYGALYNWYAVDGGDLCPSGWWVPDASDFDDLIQAAMAYGNTGDARAALQTTGSIDDGTGLWPDHIDGTNKTGWSGQPAGRRRDDGVFEGINVTGNFWSSVELGASTAEHRFLSSGNFALTATSTNKKRGSGIRCVRLTAP